MSEERRFEHRLRALLTSFEPLAEQGRRE